MWIRPRTVSTGSASFHRLLYRGSFHSCTENLIRRDRIDHAVERRDLLVVVQLAGLFHRRRGLLRVGTNGTLHAGCCVDAVMGQNVVHFCHDLRETALLAWNEDYYFIY